MTSNWNPTGCGTITGGLGCPDCPDEMPPAFKLYGTFEPADPPDPAGGCEEYDGLRLPQRDDSCDYGDYNPGIGQGFLHVSGGFQLYLDSGNVEYAKTLEAGEFCNRAHTLTKNHDVSSSCTFPDQVTIVPST